VANKFFNNLANKHCITHLSHLAAASPIFLQKFTHLTSLTIHKSKFLPSLSLLTNLQTLKIHWACEPDSHLLTPLTSLTCIHTPFALEFSTLCSLSLLTSLSCNSIRHLPERPSASLLSLQKLSCPYPLSPTTLFCITSLTSTRYREQSNFGQGEVSFSKPLLFGASGINLAMLPEYFPKIRDILSMVPSEISPIFLTNLVSLVCPDIVSVDTSLLKNLRYLYVQKFSENVLTLLNLEKIRISRNFSPIKILSPLTKLRNLEIVLPRMKMKSLPGKNIWDPDAVHEICTSFRNSELDIFKYTNLRRLNLEGDTFLSESLYQLTNLKKLEELEVDFIKKEVVAAMPHLTLLKTLSNILNENLIKI
jgi:hypothetical protein